MTKETDITRESRGNDEDYEARGSAGRVNFEVVESKTIDFGKNKFLEIARKKAMSTQTQSEFLNLSRGFYPQGVKGVKRFTNSIAIPLDKKIIKQVVDSINELGK